MVLCVVLWRSVLSFLQTAQRTQDRREETPSELDISVPEAHHNMSPPNLSTTTVASCNASAQLLMQQRTMTVPYRDHDTVTPSRSQLLRSGEANPTPWELADPHVVASHQRCDAIELDEPPRAPRGASAARYGLDLLARHKNVASYQSHHVADAACACGDSLRCFVRE